MPLDTALTLPIAVGLVLALGFGLIAHRLRLPALVGYLVAGIVAGALVPDAGDRAAGGLATAGLVLALFGLGLKVSLRQMRAVRLSIVPAALLVGIGTVALGLVFAMLMGWPAGAGLLFGLALAAPSLAAVLGGSDEADGSAAAGWAIVTSLVMVLALLVLPALAGVMGATQAVPRDPFVGVFERFTGLGANGWVLTAIVVVKLAAFIGFMAVIGRRVAPWGLRRVAAIGSRELSRLAVVVLALVLAAGSAYLFGASLALGAFLAGMILREDARSAAAARAALPLREAFAVPFFVGVGLLVEPRLLVEAPLPLIGTLLVILVGRPVLTLLAGALTRQSAGALAPVAARLAHIGEFAFLLAVTGVALGLLPVLAGHLVIAGMAVSLVVNPVLLRLADGLRPRPVTGVVLPNRVEPALVAAAPETVAVEIAPPVEAPPPAPVHAEPEAAPARPAGPATVPGTPYQVAG